jgi:GPH family glycoside/pentoside/hexuronide:cation symporter
MALKNSEVVKFSLYGPLGGIGITMAMSYFTAFQTEGLGWTAALATTVLLIPRVIDFIGGVICGSVIAKTNFKWGKYRSWLLIGAWAAWAGVILMFFNTKALPMPAQVVISGLGYTLQNFPMNFIQTAMWGLMMMMGGASMDDRIKLSVTTTRLGTLGTLVSSACLVPALAALTKVFGANPDNPNWYHPNAYMTLAIITSTLLLVGCFSMASAAKNYDKPAPVGGPGGPSLGFGDIVRGVFSNDQLLVYTLTYTVICISMYAVMPLGIFYYMYVLGNMMLMPVGMTIITVVGVAASMIGPVIGKKVGKKRALQMGLSISIIDSVLIALLAGNTNPLAGGIQMGFVIYVGFSIISSIASYIWIGFGGNYFVDAGEYGYWKSGNDNRAVAMGVGSVPMKIALIVGGAFGGYALHDIGYRPGMGVPGGPALPNTDVLQHQRFASARPGSYQRLGVYPPEFPHEFHSNRPVGPYDGDGGSVYGRPDQAVGDNYPVYHHRDSDQFRLSCPGVGGANQSVRGKPG